MKRTFLPSRKLLSVVLLAGAPLVTGCGDDSTGSTGSSSRAPDPTPCEGICGTVAADAGAPLDDGGCSIDAPCGIIAVDAGVPDDAGEADSAPSGGGFVVDAGAGDGG